MAGLSVYDGILNPGGGLVTPQSRVDEMYRGIYPVPSNVSRVTPEGLNVNRVQTVAVDPFTGNPVRAGGTTAPRTAAVLSGDSGRMTASSATQRPPANYGAVDMAYTASPKVIARTINPDGSYSDPLTAIDAAAPRQISSSPGVAWGGGWGADAIHRFLAGDPGVPTNIGGDNGLYGVPAQGFATIPNGPPTVRSVLAARAAAAPPPPATMADGLNPGVTRFLEQQGQSSTGMTAGEQANALAKAMGGSHRGSFGPGS